MNSVPMEDLGAQESAPKMPDLGDNAFIVIVQYVDKVKAALPPADYEEFTRKVQALNDVWAGQDARQDGSSTQNCCGEVARLQLEALDKVKGYPDLEQGFNIFLESSQRFTKTVRSA